jgi:hypothetical protein
MSDGTIELTEYVAPDGEVFRFNSGTKFVLTEEGLGMPNIQYITQKGPFQHGESILGYALEPRIIQMLVRQNGCSRADYWANRRAILTMLRPNHHALNSFGPGILRKIFGDGSVREIKVHVAEGPSFSARSLDKWDEWSWQEAIRFVAPDPTFYDPTLKTSTASLDTTNHLTFRNAITGPTAPGLIFYNNQYGDTNRQMLFESGLIDTNITCTNGGDWPVFPEITINGPVNGVVVNNMTTGELIRINCNLPVGQVIKVSLEYGSKLVYIQSTGESIIGMVSADSDLSTFHLEPAPGATGGVNTINIFGGQATVGVTSISITWYNRFIGI